MILDGAGLDQRLHGDVSDPRAYLLRFGYHAPPLGMVDDDAAPLVAEVNRGIWIARCHCRKRRTAEHPEAPGGVVWFDFPYIWCSRCENAECSGAWRPIRLIAPREVVEAILLARPDPDTRNWVAGESVEKLRRENRAHGLPDMAGGEV